MKLRVEHTRLKRLITEATYRDAFKMIKKGDTIIIKTGDPKNPKYIGNVVDVFGNQVRFEYGGETFIITDNSLDGSVLNANMVYKNQEGGKEKTTTTPLKGVFGILIKRGDKIVTSATPDTGRPKQQNKSQEKDQGETEDRHSEIFSAFQKMEEGDVIEITTGNIITKGVDKGSLAKNSITIIKLKHEGLTGKWIKMSPVSFTGADAADYKKYDNTYFFFDGGSIKPTKNGITLIPTTKDLDTREKGKLQIKNVFGVENIGKHEVEPEVNIKDMMKNNPTLAKMYMKNPSILDRILGKHKATGIVPLEKQLAGLGLTNKPTRGKKVKFKYNGVDIRPDFRFNFKDDKIYIGKFTKDSVIKRTADNRRESMYITLGNKNDDGTYNVTIDFVKLVNNEPQREEVGKGKIKIIELTN
jgi:TusA-related sulfurtransferase